MPYSKWKYKSIKMPLKRNALFSFSINLQVAQLFAGKAQPWAEEDISEIAGEHGEEQIVDLWKSWNNG